jgi:hypothetical protein
MIPRHEGFGHFPGTFDIRFLSRFIATHEKEIDSVSMPRQVNSITGPVVNAHFKNASTY